MNYRSVSNTDESLTLKIHLQSKQQVPRHYGHKETYLITQAKYKIKITDNRSFLQILSRFIKKLN